MFVLHNFSIVTSPELLSPNNVYLYLGSLYSWGCGFKCGAGLAQWWERARLSPMCHTWVDFVVGFHLAVRLEGFFSSYSGLPPPRKPTSSNSKSIRTNFLARTEKFGKSADAFDQDRSSLSWTSLCHIASFVTINKWTKNIFCNVLVITLEYVHYVWIVLTAVPKHNCCRSEWAWSERARQLSNQQKITL